MSSAYIGTGGAGVTAYAKGDVLSLVPTATSGVSPAKATVTSVNAGVITGLSIASAGTGWAPSVRRLQHHGRLVGAHDATFYVLMNGVATVTATTPAPASSLATP